MKFGIGEFYEGLLCPINFYIDHTVSMTTYRPTHTSQAQYVLEQNIFQTSFLEKRIIHI